MLTSARLVLSPVLLLLLLDQTNKWLALIVFLIAALTDFIDGWYARKHQLISNFGKIADPIADKALTGVAWIGLSILGFIPWVATVLILVREIGITVLRFVVIHRKVVEANRAGKWKTTLQIVTISFFIADFGIPLDILLWATVVVTVMTGVVYLRDFAKAGT